LPKGGKVLRVFDTRANNLGELAEEMGTGGGELVATDEPTVVTEPLLDVIMVKDGQSNRGLANPAGTDEGDWSEVVGKTDDLVDQLVASEEDPWCLGWRFTR